jgi:hypothetical protein
MEKIEIWKDTPNYEGHYQVSSFGNIKSLKFGKERILKPIINSHGYYSVKLSKTGKPKMFQVHVLVAMAFLNHIPCGHEIVVDHKDTIKLNNNIYNLQLITTRENLSKDKKGGSSQYTGVCWYRPYNKWLSSIQINGKLKHLGYFHCELEASKAYQKALAEL